MGRGTERHDCAGDGANDLQMMAIAGVSVGYRPKQIVAEKVDIQIAHLALDSVLGYLTPNGFAPGCDYRYRLDAGLRLTGDSRFRRG